MNGAVAIVTCGHLYTAFLGVSLAKISAPSSQAASLEFSHAANRRAGVIIKLYQSVRVGNGGLGQFVALITVLLALHSQFVVIGHSLIIQLEQNVLIVIHDRKNSLATGNGQTSTGGTRLGASPKKRGLSPPSPL